MPTTVQDIKDKYPIPVYHYLVTIDGDDSYAFSEVSGLSIEYNTITYKDGMSASEGSKHMPGMGTPVNLTLQKGIVKGDSFLYKWITNIKLNTIDKRDINVSLLNENSEPVVTWKVINAFPVKLDAPNFNAYNNEVAIESLDLMASDLKIEYQ